MTPKQKNEVKRYIDIATKAGFAIIGQDNLKNYSKKLYLVLYTNPSNNLLGILKSIKSTTDYKILESMRGENIDK